jgi:hypothetical protein
MGHLMLYLVPCNECSVSGEHAVTLLPMSSFLYPCLRLAAPDPSMTAKRHSSAFFSRLLCANVLNGIGGCEGRVHVVCCCVYTNVQGSTKVSGKKLHGVFLVGVLVWVCLCVYVQY